MPCASLARVFPAARPTAAALAACALAEGCGPATAPASPPAPEAAAASGVGFLAPPSPTQAAWTARGGVVLAGRAPPQARVAMVSPGGVQLEATAGADGRWRGAAPPAAEPTLYALSAQAGGRTLRGEGALALLPSTAATPALLLRSGAPAMLVAPPVPATLRLVSLDLDGGGGFAVSGSAPPGAAVGLSVDGVPAGQGKADAAGRFAVLSIAAPATSGEHLVAVRAGAGVDARIVSFEPASPLTVPYRTVATAQGWRVDWAPAGGGVQTLMAFTGRPHGPAPAPVVPAPPPAGAGA